MSLKDDILADILANGPMPLSDYMRRCNEHYYATRIPFGKAGDFITAPDISQMFGELIGLWCADLWQRAGAPSPFWLVELGPGRGTLMADALRATKKVAGFHDAMSVHFVEISPVLRAEQKKRVANAQWHTSLDFLSDGANHGAFPQQPPCIIIANEFFDALPISQQYKLGNVLYERVIVGDPVTGLRWALRDEQQNMILENIIMEKEQEAAFHAEHSPSAVQLLKHLVQHIEHHAGAILIVDYGHMEASPKKDTLQAMKAQKYSHPLTTPGEADITAHVNFQHLRSVCQRDDCQASCHGPTTQGQFLRKLGLDARAASLCRAHPGRADEFLAQAARLADTDQMGSLFKVMAITSPAWPMPAGFEP